MYACVSRVHNIDIANVLRLDPDEQQQIHPRLCDRLLEHPIVHRAPAFFGSGAIVGRRSPYVCARFDCDFASVNARCMPKTVRTIPGNSRTWALSPQKSSTQLKKKRDAPLLNLI